MTHRLMTYAVVALAALTSGCGDEVAVQASSPSPSVSAPVDREAMLATCPAKAPSWRDPQPARTGIPGEIDERRRMGMRHDEAYVRKLTALHDSGAGSWSEAQWPVLLTAEEEKFVFRRDQEIQPAVDRVQRYLAELPPDQVGEMRLDWAKGGLVVQVTRDAGRVQDDLATEVGEAVVDVETVRYSAGELRELQSRITDLDVPGWVSSGAGADNRVDVGVHGDVDAAQRLIETIANPCSFVVSYSEPVTADVGEPG